MLIDLWLLIDLGLQPPALNDVVRLVLSTTYWVALATILTMIVTSI